MSRALCTAGLLQQEIQGFLAQLVYLNKFVEPESCRFPSTSTGKSWDLSIVYINKNN